MSQQPPPWTEGGDADGGDGWSTVVRGSRRRREATRLESRVVRSVRAERAGDRREADRCANPACASRSECLASAGQLCVRAIRSKIPCRAEHRQPGSCPWGISCEFLHP